MAAFDRASLNATTDDNGTGTTGTIINKALLASLIYDAADGETLSATNPSVTTKSIIDEVVAARQSSASLTARVQEVLAVALVLGLAGRPVQET